MEAFLFSSQYGITKMIVIYRNYHFFDTRNTLEENIPSTGEIIQNDVHIKAFVIHKNHLNIAHLNTQLIFQHFIMNSK